MNRTAVVFLGAVVLFGACRDERTLTKPAQPSFALSDGSNGGNLHFFFLPPIVGQPNFSGTFNPHVTPVVQICQVDVASGSCLASPFSPGDVQLNGSAQQYQVNWDTQQSPLVAGMVYRVSVSVAGQPLGFADVVPVSGGVGQLKNLKTGDIFALQDGRTLPLKFRIELGAFGTNCVSDCAEATVTNDGGTVVTNTGFAGAQFPAGWLAPTSPSPVVVSIERVTTLNGLPLSGTNPCVPNALVQVQGCYRFQTIPPATFSSACITSLCVTVGICADVPPGTNPDVITLWRVEETAEPPPPTELTNVPAPFVTCAGFASSAPRGGWWGNLAGGLWRHLEALVTPTPAYAFHLGAGGSTCCFSRIGWAVPAGTLIDFDVAPGGTPLTPGTVINTTYPGVTFSRVMIPEGSLCGSSNAVYVNDNGPLPGGGFGFGSGDNVVTVCPENTASDFNESSFGRIQATFPGGATEVCIQVYVTGGPAPATGFLAAFNSSNLEFTADTSAANASGQRLCVSGTITNPNISYVQFAGLVGGFAIFDNMVVQFAPPPPL
jgi:hypothetical protein